MVEVVEDDGSGRQSLEAEQRRYDSYITSGKRLMQYRPGPAKPRRTYTELELLLLEKNPKLNGWL